MLLVWSSDLCAAAAAFATCCAAADRGCLGGLGRRSVGAGRVTGLLTRRAAAAAVALIASQDRLVPGLACCACRQFRGSQSSNTWWQVLADGCASWCADQPVLLLVPCLMLLVGLWERCQCRPLCQSCKGPRQQQAVPAAGGSCCLQRLHRRSVGPDLMWPPAALSFCG